MENEKTYSIGVLGAGTWGVALARMLYNRGHQVTVWSAIGEEIDELSATYRHKNLPGTLIPEGIVFTWLICFRTFFGSNFDIRRR